MSDDIIFPCSPQDEVLGIPYFARMCHKIRLERDGDLDKDYQPNLGKGFDKWICELLEIDYADLVKIVHMENSNETVLYWAYENGIKPESPKLDWWLSYMRNRGHNDDLSEKLEKRKVDAGFGGRDDIASFFDFIDAEEGRD